MKVLGRLVGFAHLVSSISGYISMGACVLMVLLCLSEVFVRTALHSSLIFTEELLGWLLVCMVFMGLSWTLRVGGHIQVNFVQERLPQKIQDRVRICVIIVAIASVALLCVSVWTLLIDTYHADARGQNIFRLPLWWALTPMFLGLVMFAIQLLGALFDNVISISKSVIKGQRTFFENEK